MKKILLAAMAFIAVAHAAWADPIIVVRPAIGSGTAGVIPQNAFTSAVGPATPTIPVTPTPPTGPVVFTSVGYGNSLPTTDGQVIVNQNREFAMPWGNPYCTIIDSSNSNRDSKLIFSYYPGSGSNTPAVMVKLLDQGVYKLLLSCGQSSQAHSPAVQYNLVAN